MSNDNGHQSDRCRVKELEAENALLKRKAAAWDWCNQHTAYPKMLAANQWLIFRYDRVISGTTPLEAVEAAMKQEAK